MSIQTFLLPFSHASKNLTEALFYCNLIHLIPLLKWPSWLFEAISTFLKVQVKAFWEILKLFGCTHTESEHIMCLFQAWILNTRFAYWTYFPEQLTYFSNTFGWRFKSQLSNFMMNAKLSQQSFGPTIRTDSSNGFEIVLISPISWR